ncbi:GNAT family N-acetyltransferase [Nocardia sp. NPDC050718]|uniref:GNAT family N-acetyltransferase n=1 Tax=Nocardia sp. NPDC050718 TaxID=3155788 RepID=UPI0033FEC9BA
MTTQPETATTVRRTGTADDLAAAARLLVDFNREFDEPAPEPDELAAHLADLLAAGDTDVLLIGTPAVGVAVLRARVSTWSATVEVDLDEFYVVPGVRGRGLGSALLAGVLDRARDRGATFIGLSTSEDDTAARRVYEKHGFACHEGAAAGPMALYYQRDLD